MRLPWERKPPDPTMDAGNRGRVIFATLGDTHAGHQHALMNPEVILFAEGPEGERRPFTPQPTPIQEEIWEAFCADGQKLAELAGPDDIVLLHNGDATWGNKYPYQMVTTRISDQIDIAVANLTPLVALPNVKVVRLSMSTPSHGFQEGAADILIAKELQLAFPDKDIRVVYHGRANIAGVEVDYAHHGPYPGSRSWLKGNVARLYLRDLLMRKIMSGKRPPDLVIRSHYHEYTEVEDNIKANSHHYRSHLVITPSYMMMSDFARQVTRSSDSVEIGMVAFEIVDGELTWPPHLLSRSYDLPTKEAFYV